MANTYPLGSIIILKYDLKALSIKTDDYIKTILYKLLYIYLSY